MEHQFTLILSGIREEDFTSDLADRLYEATQGDIEFSMSQDVARLDFRRCGPSLSAAVQTAIDEVRGAELGFTVTEVKIDDLDEINAKLAKAAID